MAHEWIWVSEADVVSALDMGDAIRAVRAGLLDEAGGRARNMVKTVAKWDGGTLHAIGATFVASGVVGTKTWAHTPGGASPLLILFDSECGDLLAVMEAFALGQLRTGAVSGVMTDALADPAAEELAIIGTGKQALAQVAAVAAVRPIARVRIFGRDARRREAFATHVEQALNVGTTCYESVEEAVKDAPIITLVTRATESFLNADMVAKGAHVNALGAITKERSEFQSDLLERCHVVVTDSVEAAQNLSSEFIEYFGARDGGWEAVQTMGAVLEAGTGRPPGADVTLSKAMGTGVCDVAVGLACFQAMSENGLGRPMDQPKPIPPRLRARSDVTGIGYV